MKKAIGKQSANRGKNGRFKKGNNANTGGFQVNPQNINKTGENKGSKWKSTFLRELLEVKLSESELEDFSVLAKKFPSIFDGTNEQNLALYLEVRQISLAFSKDPNVAQRAIKEIKDRVFGKPVSIIEHTGKGGGPMEFAHLTNEELEEKLRNLDS